MNFFVVMLGLIAVALPAAPFWDGRPFQLRVRHGAAHCCRQSDGISGRFVSDAYVMSRMKVASGGRHFSARAIWSTVVARRPIR